MSAQVEPGALIPDGLAARLAGHYAPNAMCGLAALHWTGEVRHGTWHDARVLAEDLDGPHRTVNGHRDPQGVAAELRALAHYCCVFSPREAVDGWRVWTPAKGDEGAMVVPWAWREST